MFRKIKDDIYSVGVIDWHRKLFDELIPLPDGTSYNSYFIRGEEKNAIIDTVEPDFVEDFLDNLDDLGVEKIDYIISNHAEQDHSGSIPYLLEKYPEAEVLSSKKAKGMLLDLLEIEEDKIRIVEDGETVDLEAIPEDGYYFDRWSSQIEGYNDAEVFNDRFNKDTQFDIKDFREEVMKVTAEMLKENHTLSLENGIEGGSIGFTGYNSDTKT